MNATLPCTATEVTLHSLSRATCRDLLAKERTRTTLRARALAGEAEAATQLEADTYPEVLENAVRDLYPDLSAQWDTMPNRDVETLIRLTYRYSLGVPEDELGN